MDKEMEQFQADLMEAVRDMKAGRAARSHKVPLTEAAEACAQVGLSQRQFSALLGVSVRTLQGWKQGRKRPSGAARTLLAIARSNPAVVIAVAT